MFDSRRVSIGLLAVGGTLALAGSPSAFGAVTIGSDLDPAFPPSVDIDCELTACTAFQLAHPDAQITSPVDGVVVRYRIRKSSSGVTWGDVALRILRPIDGGATFDAVGTSAATPSEGDENPIREFPTQLPITTGDHIGIDVTAKYQVVEGILGTVGEFRPPLEDTDPAATPGSPGPILELPLNADIEPDCDGDGFGDETQDADILSCTPPPDPPDTDPPETTITKGPANKSARHKVKYKFDSDEPNSTFECKLDKKPYKPCTSPKRVRVDDGKHKFAVRATDAAGNVDLTPDKDKFNVVG